MRTVLQRLLARDIARPDSSKVAPPLPRSRARLCRGPGARLPTSSQADERLPGGAGPLVAERGGLGCSAPVDLATGSRLRSFLAPPVARALRARDDASLRHVTEPGSPSRNFSNRERLSRLSTCPTESLDGCTPMVLTGKSSCRGTGIGNCRCTPCLAA